MSQTDYKRSVIVGAFITIGLIIIIGGIFLIGTKEQLFGKQVSVKVIFDDVGGLQKGNNVWLSGVKIGTVKNVSIIGHGKVQATLNIQRAAASFIFKNTKAKIGSDGFIGNRIIVLYGGLENSGMITNGEILAGEQAVSSDQMLLTLQASNKNMLQITEELKQIIHGISKGTGTLGVLIKDDAIVKQLQTAITNTKDASVKTNEALNDVRRFTQKLNSSGGLADKLITDTIIFSTIVDVVSQIRETSLSASRLVENLELASKNLSNKNAPAGMLLENEQVALDIKEMISNLKVSSKKLDEDLEAVQHSIFLRKYFKKKSKQE